MPSLRIRCVCGQEFLADQLDAGKGIRCRCGRVVRIPGPPSGPRVPGSAPSGHSEGRAALPRLAFPLPPWARPAAAGLNLLYGAGVLASALLLWLLADRWWPATVLAYGPRWLLLLPAVPLAIATLVVWPRVLLVTAAAAVVALGPVMGFRTGWRTWLAGRSNPAVRVVTFNVHGSENPMIGAVPGELARLRPDLMLFQECPDELVTAARTATPLAGWTVRKDGTLCLASRWPVDSVRAIEEVRTRDQGGTGAVVFYRILHPVEPFGLANVHLETPGKGLEPFREEGNTSRLIRNSMLRDVGSRRAIRWIIAQHFEPLIAGDFNLTVESRIFRDHWSGCPDAFSRVGWGFGWTRELRWFSARIDHVIACGSWTASWAEVGPDLGSDHRPLVADLMR